MFEITFETFGIILRYFESMAVFPFSTGCSEGAFSNSRAKNTPRNFLSMNVKLKFLVRTKPGGFSREDPAFQRQHKLPAQLLRSSREIRQGFLLQAEVVDAVHNRIIPTTAMAVDA